jgi:hypothetical protein
VWQSSPLVKDTVLPPSSSQGQILRFPETILRADLLADIAQRGLTVREVQMFISPAMYYMKTHIDGGNIHERGAINYSLVSRLWAMNWFEYTAALPQQQTTAAGTDYLALDPNQCQLAHTASWAHAAIVRTGRAHNIINRDILPRYCVSIRFQDNDYEFLKSKFI